MVKFVIRTTITEILKTVTSPLEKDVYLVRSVQTRNLLFLCQEPEGPQFTGPPEG